MCQSDFSHGGLSFLHQRAQDQRTTFGLLVGVLTFLLIKLMLLLWVEKGDVWADMEQRLQPPEDQFNAM